MTHLEQTRATGEQVSAKFRRLVADAPPAKQSPPAAILVVGDANLHLRVLDAARDAGLEPVIETSNPEGAVRALIAFSVLRAVVDLSVRRASVVLATLRAKGIPVAVIGEVPDDLEGVDVLGASTVRAIREWLVNV